MTNKENNEAPFNRKVLKRFNHIVLKLENDIFLFGTLKNDIEGRYKKTRNIIITILFLVLSSIGLIVWDLFN